LTDLDLKIFACDIGSEAFDAVYVLAASGITAKQKGYDPEPVAKIPKLVKNTPRDNSVRSQRDLAGSNQRD